MISSRTPDGEQARCPLCGQEVRVIPAQFYGDAPCPSCGTLLWFIRLPSRIRLYDPLDAELARERVRRLIAEQLGIEPTAVDLDKQGHIGPESDSLDMAELVMELEEDFD